MEERDKELRKIENIHKLLAEADKISFDCPEIATLRERSEDIAKFQRDAQSALRNHTLHPTQAFMDLAERGKGFNVDIPEVEELENVVKQMKWNDQAQDMRTQPQTLTDVASLIDQSQELGIPANDENLIFLQEQNAQGE